VRRSLIGASVGVVFAIVIGAALLPLRSHISVSTAALILVIPVVFGAARGGFLAGTASVIAGFLVFDFEFIPPYGTLTVGATQNWTALAVYVVVMLIVAQVVARLNSARSQAVRGEAAMRRLSELSELLVGDQPVETLLRTIVHAARSVFDLQGVSLLTLEGGRLTVAASAGEPLTSEELHRLDPVSGLPVSVGTAMGSPSGLRTVALSASGSPVGILAMRGLPESRAERAVISTFANDAALAIERAQLREQALRTHLLEEVDRLRRGLMGAVSHDLRTPLATIKVASSTLAHRSASLSTTETKELVQLIEIEADRLTRLVTNLLDMTRIESGVLEAHSSPTPVGDIVSEAIDALGPTLDQHECRVDLAADLPLVDADRLLIVQVLINLLDNAVRYSPVQSLISVTGVRKDGEVEVAVSDQGSGVRPGDREIVFDRFAQIETGGRAGLGLTIAKTFVEAHGQRIWCEESPGGGARFVFTLPVAPVSA
jgi:two-component system sensor histidine kinase KdpD